MLFFIQVGKLIDTHPHSVSLLLFVASLMLLYNPAYINNVGFQLSFIVTFGLLTTGMVVFEKCKDIKVPKHTDVRFYACVVDKNRAGAKPTLLFKLNLAYNEWEELGHLRLKQTEEEQEN